MSQVIKDFLNWMKGRAKEEDISKKGITIPGMSFEDLTGEELAVLSSLMSLIANRLCPEKMEFRDFAKYGSPMRNISVRLDAPVLASLDKFIELGKFSSRGHGVRQALMALLDPSLSVEVRSIRDVSVTDQGLVVENTVCHDPLLVHVGTNITMTFGDKVEEGERKEERGFFVFDHVEAGRIIMKVYSPEAAKLAVAAETQKNKIISDALDKGGEDDR